MQKVKLFVQSPIPHNSQIITGFYELQKQGYPVEIVDRTDDSSMDGSPFIEAVSAGGTIVYDLGDGYNAPDHMLQYLKRCDVYFKRSFSVRRNEELFPEYRHKMYPLGFNYHVTCKENPINEPMWKHLLKPLLGRTPDRYFIPQVFEGKAEPKEAEQVRILFLARLWDDHEQGFSDEENAERTYINHMRIDIIRALREKYGDMFVGGLNDTALSRAWAPDLIMPAQYTERRKYLKLLHSSDICIGSMGLFESIGWKTGEYVAAAKAIVNEKMHFSVTGDFEAGRNYLPFETAQECLDAVESLVKDPRRLYEMKLANQRYYQEYLRPDMLVKHSLEVANRHMGEKFMEK